jgi:DNA polymerase-4
LYFENAEKFYKTAKQLWELRPFDKAIRLLGLSLSNLNTEEKAGFRSAKNSIYGV